LLDAEAAKTAQLDPPTLHERVSERIEYCVHQDLGFAQLEVRAANEQLLDDAPLGHWQTASGDVPRVAAI
jgi:hypothetical protein